MAHTHRTCNRYTYASYIQHEMSIKTSLDEECIVAGSSAQAAAYGALVTRPSHQSRDAVNMSVLDQCFMMKEKRPSGKRRLRALRFSVWVFHVCSKVSEIWTVEGDMFTTQLHW
jgi:hypothetical protein